jgi:hypothetical protein
MLEVYIKILRYTDNIHKRQCCLKLGQRDYIKICIRTGGLPFANRAGYIHNVYHVFVLSLVSVLEMSLKNIICRDNTASRYSVVGNGALTVQPFRAEERKKRKTVLTFALAVTVLRTVAKSRLNRQLLHGGCAVGESVPFSSSACNTSIWSMGCYTLLWHYQGMQPYSLRRKGT